MRHLLIRIVPLAAASLLLACMGEDDAPKRAIARIRSESPLEGILRETFHYRADGSVCREKYADDDYEQTEFFSQGRTTHTYYFGDPSNATYTYWDWVTPDSVVFTLRYKKQFVSGADSSARRYFRNASGGVDSIRAYQWPGDRLDETLIYEKTADGSWEVEHRRDPFDRATLSVYKRYFRDARGEIDSAIQYSRWYGGIHTGGDTNYNADTVRSVYYYDRLDRLLGGSKCDAPD